MCPVRSSSSAPRRAARAAAVAALFLAGCKVDAEVAIEADSDGSGDVIATVTLDEAAAAEIGDLDENVRLDDLRDAGWTVVVGDNTVTATKPYEHPDEATTLLQEVSGPLVSRAQVTRDVGFAKTTTEVDVALDLTSGLQGFADQALLDQLGGLPTGFDAKNLEVVLRAEPHGEDPVTAKVPVGETASVTAKGTDWHVIRLAAALAAPILAIAAAVLFMRRRTIPVPVTDDP